VRELDQRDRDEKILLHRPRQLDPQQQQQQLPASQPEPRMANK